MKELRNCSWEEVIQDKGISKSSNNIYCEVRIFIVKWNAGCGFWVFVPLQLTIGQSRHGRLRLEPKQGSAIIVAARDRNVAMMWQSVM